jgi:RNA polymerase sigma-70 factor (ECF subfamily)
MADFPPTRASLLLRLRDPHDEDAWRQFVDLYAPLVYGYARDQGLQNADAADLSQEVLRVVVGAIGRLDYDPGRGAFRNWLFTVVRRKLSNWRRARQNRPDTRNGAADPHALVQYPVPDPQEAEWEVQWQRRVFAWACEQVRADVRDLTWQAFWKTAVDGQPAQQVAEELGLTLTRVYNARSRVFARVKTLIQSVEEP